MQKLHGLVGKVYPKFGPLNMILKTAQHERNHRPNSLFDPKEKLVICLAERPDDINSASYSF